MGRKENVFLLFSQKGAANHFTHSQYTPSNASSQLTASNTLHNTTMTGTMNMSAINTGAGSAQSFVTLDGSGNAYEEGYGEFRMNRWPQFFFVEKNTKNLSLHLKNFRK